MPILKSRLWFTLLPLFPSSTIPSAQKYTSPPTRFNQIQEVGKRQIKKANKTNLKKYKIALTITLLSAILFLAVLTYKKNKKGSKNGDGKSRNGRQNGDPNPYDNEDRVKSSNASLGQRKIDKKHVPLTGSRQYWDAKYPIYQSTIIPTKSIIITSKKVQATYYSYRSPQDIFTRLDRTKTLFVNAANAKMVFGMGGTNLFLTNRICEKDQTKSKFRHVRNIDKDFTQLQKNRKGWGTIKDREGNIWDKQKLAVGELVISYEEKSKLHIAHILAPNGTTEGHNQLKKGIAELVMYAYEKQEFNFLILCAPGTSIFAGSSAKIGNGAYQAIIQGVEEALVNIEKKANGAGHAFTICLNWWDSRIVVNVPKLGS